MKKLIVVGILIFISYYFFHPILFLLACLGLAPALCVGIFEIIFELRDNGSSGNIPTKKKVIDNINLKPYSGTITLISYSIVFSVLIGLFSWKIYDSPLNPSNLFTMEEEIEMEIPPTTQPPPPPPPPVVQIEIVKDEDIIQEEEIPEVEIDEDEDIDLDIIDEEIDEEEVFIIVDDQPEFPGGNMALFNFINKNIKYAHQAIEMEIEGMVVVQFVVNKKGEINDVKILKSLGGGCDEEALRIVKGMPKWKAGRQHGRPVNVSFKLPFRFQFR